MKIALLFFLSLGCSLIAKPPELEQVLLKKILTPWVDVHYPKFHYKGKAEGDDAQISWSFQNIDDPKLQKTFPLDVEMDYCRTEKTAHLYFHRGDANEAEALKTGMLPESGRVPTKIGNESDAFDIRETGNHRAQGDIGGWLRCRVGTCIILVRSYSVTFEDLKDLAGKIAAALPELPEPPASLQKNGELAYLKEIAASEKEQREKVEYNFRLLSKTFTTAGELFEEYSKSGEGEKVDAAQDGVTPWARPYRRDDPGVTEIAMERGGCYGTCPQYAVKITSNGKVQYFGRNYVKRLGNSTGQIPMEEFRGLAEFVKDAGVAGMHDMYVNDVTDYETVYTAFTINGKQKLIMNYADSGPSSLWAIEQLIDKLVAETEWDAPKKSAGKK